MKHKRLRPKHRRFNLMATNAGPWVIVGSLVLGIAVAIVLIFKFAIPFGFSLFGATVPWQPTPTPMPTPVPTPTPHPIMTTDIGILQKEIVFDVQYISDPFLYEGIVYYTGGRDDKGGPKMSQMYTYDIEAQHHEALEIPIKHDDLFTPQRNETYMVWLDHLRIGGGSIMAMDLATNKTFEVKRYYAGKPEIKLSGHYLVWSERTGSYMDKIFLYDLATGENTTLDMMDNSPFGVSAPDIAKDEVIWASYDTNSSSEDKNTILGGIYTIALDGSGSAPIVYSPGTYVHNPVTNGDVYAWSDGNHSPTSKLYISQQKKTPQLIAQDVTDYALGSSFIAYTENEKLHIYFYGNRAFDKIITLEGERSMLLGVSDDTVFWYHLGLGSKDIVKYARIGAQ